MKKAAAPKEMMTVRIPADLKRQLSEASEVGPYRIPVSSLIERGIELALKEFRELRKSK